MAGSSLRQPDRFLLWIDSVGGFLVCLKEEVVIGQPGCGGEEAGRNGGPARAAGWRPVPQEVDVPIMADLSRRHARIRRDGEGYLIEAVRDVRVDGRKAEAVASLSDGCRIELGEGVRMVFRKPNALSATARLDLVSRHHTEPRTDGVLLMAESCILGPKRHSHVVCPGWKQELVLYRHKDALYCRTPGAMEIDGASWTDRGGPLRPDSHIKTEQFSLGLEPV